MEASGFVDDAATLKASAIDYSAAHDLAYEVRAFAIIESREKEHQVGESGRTYGLLHMHPATFKHYYGAQMRFAPHVNDTWTEAQIKACAAFLAAQSERDLISQAWNLSEAAVFLEHRRNPEYLERWRDVYDKVRGAAK